MKITFLHGDLEKKNYMEQLEVFRVNDKKACVCRLKKSLYGLNQALTQCCKKFESVLEEYGYKKTTFDHYVYVQKFCDGDFIILLFYVYDMLIGIF